MPFGLIHPPFQHPHAFTRTETHTKPKHKTHTTHTSTHRSWTGATTYKSSGTTGSYSGTMAWSTFLRGHSGYGGLAGWEMGKGEGFGVLAVALGADAHERFFLAGRDDEPGFRVTHYTCRSVPCWFVTLFLSQKTYNSATLPRSYVARLLRVRSHSEVYQRALGVVVGGASACAARLPAHLPACPPARPPHDYTQQHNSTRHSGNKNKVYVMWRWYKGACENYP